jgi:hypothetical protein
MDQNLKDVVAEAVKNQVEIREALAAQWKRFEGITKVKDAVIDEWTRNGPHGVEGEQEFRAALKRATAAVYAFTEWQSTSNARLIGFIQEAVEIDDSDIALRTSVWDEIRSESLFILNQKIPELEGIMVDLERSATNLQDFVEGRSHRGNGS